MTDHLITVTVPCQYVTEDGEPCEADVSMTVECTPGEPQTHDYPGTRENWTVGWNPDTRCRYHHFLDAQSAEWRDIADRAIHTAQEEAGR
jgi:hypothetical protein